MLNYKLINNVLGWAIFSIAAFVYCSTIEPTASFWDCGEYISTAYKLEVGHPPGAPLFQMLGRFFSLFASDTAHVAMMINIMSALSSAFSILFLFWSITMLAKKAVLIKGGILSTGSTIAIFGSGIVGALAYTFSDSFWFSAVEGEVYAMSSLCTAAVFWAILKWETEAEDPHSNRWLILIAYLIGLSIGVHLLNLLAIPAIVFIYYFKKFPYTRKGLLITFGVAIVLLGTVQNLIIPGIVSLAANFEIMFVNKFGLSYNSGTIFYFIQLTTLIVIGLIYTHKPSDKLFNILLGLGILFALLSAFSGLSNGTKAMRILLMASVIVLAYFFRTRYALMHNIVLCFTMILIGYSSFVMLVIRSQTNTPMDENNPENAVNLLAYLNREQYGDWPIAYGQYYNAPLESKDLDGDGRADSYTDGTPVYGKPIAKDNTDIPTNNEQSGYRKTKDKGYIVTDDRKFSIPNYDKRFCTVFPRMWSSQTNHEAKYKDWGRIKGERIRVDNGRGEVEELIKPTFFENLTYFGRYQVGWMYFRYFLWNFSGKQNDVQGHGNASEGNWITGINFVDEYFYGPQPKSVTDNKGNNKFYALPLILGLIGFFYHLYKSKHDWLVVMLLFLFTGMAIVIYLNQYPYQPRERDYAYAASFYAFAIWIGFAVLAIWDTLQKYVKAPSVVAGTVATVAGILAAPTLMAKDGWDDHDRSSRYTARDFAIDYLESCAPNAILFTNGDNDTFPLWYVQEVEGIRTDVRVCNLSLLNTDWYIDQMKRKAYESDAVPFSLTPDKYVQGTRDYVPFYTDKKINGYIRVRKLIDFVAREDDEAKLDYGHKKLNYFPTKMMSVPVNMQKVISNGTVDTTIVGASRIVPSIDWVINKGYILKSELMVLDLLATNNWDRPVYFATTTGPESYIGLDEHFQLEGLAYRLVPVKTKPEEQLLKGSGVRARIDSKKMYDNVMNKFKWGGMENGVYLDENALRMASNIRSQMGILASTLVQEGKKDSALKVLDKCVQVTPKSNVPYDYSMLNIVMGYFGVGANDKAIALSKEIFDIYEDNYKSYLSLNTTQALQNYYRDIALTQEILQRLVFIANSNKQKAVADDFDKRFLALQQIAQAKGLNLNEDRQ